jgi:hypothetical protein
LLPPGPGQLTVTSQSKKINQQPRRVANSRITVLNLSTVSFVDSHSLSHPPNQATKQLSKHHHLTYCNHDEDVSLSNRCRDNVRIGFLTDADARTYPQCLCVCRMISISWIARVLESFGPRTHRILATTLVRFGNPSFRCFTDLLVTF